MSQQAEHFTYHEAPRKWHVPFWTGEEWYCLRPGCDWTNDGKNSIEEQRYGSAVRRHYHYEDESEARHFNGRASEETTDCGEEEHQDGGHGPAGAEV